MTIEIVEVLRRSEQGMTQPFICRGDDGVTYFVKGRRAGRKSLIAEWVVGNLAQALDLPVPSFEIVSVPARLLDAYGSDEYRLELGAGLAFGSSARTATEFSWSRIDQVPDDLQISVFAFDWWVRNGDRMLSERGGNPNLFWDEVADELIILDHNLAFDSDLSAADFLANHAFCAHGARLEADCELQEGFRRACIGALPVATSALANTPESWWYQDPEQTVPIALRPDTVLDLLGKCKSDDFWPWQR